MGIGQGPRFGVVLAGVRSGTGKTTLTLGLIRLLKDAGLMVQAFKAGPDFIDPGYHALASGRPCHNLDTWMIPQAQLKRIFLDYSKDCDCAIVEGVMGLFDGVMGDPDLGSTAHLAKCLGLPIFLVIDCKGLARSIVPLVKGFLTFDPALDIRGIILNRFGSPAHFSYLKSFIEEELQGVKVVSGLPRKKDLVIPSRHLGLGLAIELEERQLFFKRVAQEMSRFTDLDTLLHAMERQAPLFCHFDDSVKERDNLRRGGASGAFKGVRVAVAMDEAFSFYYEENLSCLQRLGAEIMPFSPINDKRLPEGAGLLYLGGGYPELFLEELSLNKELMAEIKRTIEHGIPCLSECGGMMYLSQGIYLGDGTFRSMVGVLPFSCRMLAQKSSLGYRLVECIHPCILGERGTRARGHEFHYSEIVDKMVPLPPAFRTFNAKGMEFGDRGYVAGPLVSSYVHLHFASNPRIAENLLSSALRYQQQRRR